MASCRSFRFQEGMKHVIDAEMLAIYVLSLLSGAMFFYVATRESKS